VVPLLSFSAAAAVIALLILIRVNRSERQWSAELARQVEDARIELVRNTELEGQLAQALDAMDMGVILSRSDGTVVFRNDAADDLVTARHGKALVEAAAQELLVEALDGRPGEREVDLFGPPATSFLIRSFPLSTSADAPSTVIGALALVDDSTERHRVDAVRRDFVANISHELRTPIGAMGLLAETILDEEDRDTIGRLSARMVDEAHRVSRTIDDLLELSRIEFGDETQIEAVAVGEVIRETVARLRAAAEQHEVLIETSAAPELLIRGDRRQLVSAVFNLVDNAVKYSPPGHSVRIDASATDGRISIAVVDEGVGIPERDLDRIFERFYRVDRARSRVTGGTGLGLAIVRHVASNHGGDVTVSSHEGQGSTFTLALPLAVHPARPTPVVSASLRPLEGSH